MANLSLSIKHSRLEPHWQMLIWLLIVQILVAFVGRGLVPLGVLIGADLSLTKAQIGMFPAGLFLGQAMSSIPAGFLVDRLGSRRLLLALSLCLGVGFMFSTLFTHFWSMLLFVVIGGLGYGAMHPVSNRGIIYWFTQTQRGTAMGIKQMGVTLGSALSAVILLPIAASYGWRTAVIGAATLLILIGVLSFFQYRDSDSAPQRNSDQKLSVFYKAMWKMLQNKPLLLVSLSALGLNGAQMCLNTYLVLFAYEKMGISLFLSGVLLVISEACGSFGRVAWGVISDKVFNGERLIIIIMIVILSALASSTLALLPAHTPFGVLVPIIAIFGFAVSGFNGIWMNLASELVPPEQSGISSGLSITIGSFGVIAAPPVFGFMVDLNGSYTSGWFFITGLLCVVFVILLVLFNVNKKKKERVEERAI
ncbi:MFS transporter [Fictibacillus phosphorivorans]|uniref:MFS transporter n=1 Tax=Fictibacillus phosphorivorans TaxID=1221500 RepID=UPI00203EAFFC|nr:MFS transporter [Fictibacillus phosphorivorans]MCM3718092.1 MFS transporter [Fictibacillus phosphorivorans]MCM3775719.1 MFS transporter [Fictibacillus phosphorivorans]